MTPPPRPWMVLIAGIVLIVVLAVACSRLSTLIVHAAPSVTTRWVDQQHIEICAPAGELQVRISGVLHFIDPWPGGCHTWTALDTGWAPAPGAVYCVDSVCAAPLPAWRYLYLPVLRR